MKKFVWLISCLMILSLMVVSCGGEEEAGGTVTTEDQGQTVTVGGDEGETPAGNGGESTVVPSGEPQYGGTLSVVTPGDVMGFDELTTPDYWDVVGHLTCDELLEGDWARGPAGTGEFSWATNDVYRWDSKSGALAESFEIIEPGHVILNIRHGVHFGLNPDSEASRKVGGREMSGDDVYWNVTRWIYGEGSQVARSARTMADTIDITQLDKWTIDLKVPTEETIYLASYLVDWCSVYPPEVIETYGDMNDWENNVGTGPYFITDYVRSSVVTLKRNPNYWQTDPVGLGMGNQLPYVETVKYLIITDASTIEAAVRTGQVDVNFGVSLDTLDNLTKTATDLIVKKYVPAASSSIGMRTDKTELPFSKKEVRQALMMAIDYESIIDELYYGEAQLPSFPIVPEPELMDAYITLDEAPEAVGELFSYNPEKAKQLLSAAGYPNGFKTSIICTNPSVDYLSIIKDMWAQIGVDLEIITEEIGAYNSRWATRNYDELFQTLWPSSGTYVRMLALTGTGVGQNLSFVNDPKVNETRAKMLDAFAAGDQTTVDTLFKNLLPYILEQAWCIQAPIPYVHTVWWPWLKGYNGEYSPGVCNEYRWAKYVWIDQELKRSMGY
jgi:peptide/nickel transport system substrate-binding protein